MKDLTNININKLHPFEGHPFKVRDNEEMNQLVESIQKQGIAEPLLVRPLENTTDGYEVISDDYDFLRGSELIIERIKAIGLCRNCGTEFPIVAN